MVEAGMDQNQRRPAALACMCACPLRSAALSLARRLTCPGRPACVRRRRLVVRSGLGGLNDDDGGGRLESPRAEERERMTGSAEDNTLQWL